MMKLPPIPQVRIFDLSKFGVGFQSLNPVQNSEMVINFENEDPKMSTNTIPVDY